MDMYATIAEALDFAIAEEEQAAAFYKRLTCDAPPAMRTTFEQLSREECAHKAKLEAVKAGSLRLETRPGGPPLSVADYRVVHEDTPARTYPEALLLAIQKEKAAYGLYLHLAEVTTGRAVREMFRGLANEEASHRLRLELEYEAFVEPDN